MNVKYCIRTFRKLPLICNTIIVSIYAILPRNEFSVQMRAMACEILHENRVKFVRSSIRSHCRSESRLSRRSKTRESPRASENKKKKRPGVSSYLRIINNTGIKSVAIECSLIHKRSLSAQMNAGPDRYKGILRACLARVSSGQYRRFVEYNY